MTKWILPLAFVVLCGSVNAQSGDPSGFTEALNGVRATVGLPPVSFSSASVPVSVGNNAEIRQRNMLGHFITGGLAQCAAVGCGDTGGVLSMWLNSPPHAAIILSPALTAVGYANDGYAASVACSMGQAYPPAHFGGQAAAPASYAAPAYIPARRGLFGRIK